MYAVFNIRVEGGIAHQKERKRPHAPRIKYAKLILYKPIIAKPTF